MIDKYLTSLRNRNQRPATLKQRRVVLRAFSRSCDLATVNRHELEDLLTAYPHPQTRASYLAALRGFYRWAIPDLRDDDPTERIQRPRIPRRLPRPIPDADLERALSLAPERMRLWLLLGCDAGMRACEVAAMHRDDIGERILIPVAKGGDPAHVPMTPRLIDALDNWPARGWMWKVTGPLSAQAVSAGGTAFLRSIGLNATYHATRHTYVTRVAKLSGGDAFLTAELARHRNLQTTMGYVQTDTDRIKALLGGFPAA